MGETTNPRSVTSSAFLRLEIMKKLKFALAASIGVAIYSSITIWLSLAADKRDADYRMTEIPRRPPGGVCTPDYGGGRSGRKE